MKHLSYRRIIILAEKIDLASQEEKEHIESCPHCHDQIVILSGLDKKINEMSRIEPLVNSDYVGELADAVFDRYYKPEKKKASLTPSYFIISFFSAVFAIFVLFVFSSIFNIGGMLFPPALENDTPEKYIYSEHVSEITPEIEEYPPFGEIDEGTTIKRDRYAVHILKDSIFFEENDNYITVRSGEILFKVERGGDFVVNLNNIGLVRVIGTSFTVNIGRNNALVEVVEGLVEVIDLGKGESTKLSAGQSSIVQKLATVNKKVSKPSNTNSPSARPSIETPSTALSTEMENLFRYIGKEESKVAGMSATGKKSRYKFRKDTAMMEAEIRDLEFLLKFSNAPVAQLHELFALLSERKHYGSIIHYWRVYSKQINSKANPFLQEMHRDACEASIKLFLYDNGICRKYRKLYPNGPDPSGMKDHLDMAW